MKYPANIVKAVTWQVISMLENNVLRDCGLESFRGWCENGNVFFFDEQDLTDEERDECCRMMLDVADAVDNLTYNWLNTEED